MQVLKHKLNAPFSLNSLGGGALQLMVQPRPGSTQVQSACVVTTPHHSSQAFVRGSVRTASTYQEYLDVRPHT